MVPAPTLSLGDLPVPRRAAIAELLETIHHTEAELAALGAALAARPGPPAFRAALAALAEAQAPRVAATAALARAATGVAPAAPAPAPSRVVSPLSAGRDELFARIVGAARTLESAYREVASLLRDVSRCPDLPELGAGTADLRRRLRALYVRYS